MNITRFAPSPTGRLHLGHAFSALLGASTLENGGKFLVRIEDLDQTRSRPEFVEGIFEDLRWVGLNWDEPVLVQSERGDAYGKALDRLRELGLVYPCFCTRADIAAALEAPHGPLRAHYPGTCRGIPDDPDRRSAMPHSWRLHARKALAQAGTVSWTEVNWRKFQADAAEFDDIILARKDAPAAYHLACVVDDAASGITLVTRAADLRSSTPVQRLLQMLLGLPEPFYLHHKLVAHADGRRLAKRDRAPTLAAIRESGVDGRALAMDLLAGKLPLGFSLVDA